MVLRRHSEDILDELASTGMRNKRLIWHYRSLHEGLIAFSNSQYYNNELLTFPAESATAQCSRKGDELNRLFESTTTAAQVFPSIHQRSFQNIVLREEAVSLGKYGCLTLFTLLAPFPAEIIRARTRELGFEMK